MQSASLLHVLQLQLQLPSERLHRPVLHVLQLLLSECHFHACTDRIITRRWHFPFIARVSGAALSSFCLVAKGLDEQ
jgi:hypothetical protein